MSIPPVGFGQPIYDAVPPQEQAQNLLQQIRDDLNQLGGNPDDSQALKSLAKDMKQLHNVVKSNPGSFSKEQIRTTKNLYEQFQTMAGQMGTPTPGEIVNLAFTAQQLHFGLLQ